MEELDENKTKQNKKMLNIHLSYEPALVILGIYLR